MPTKLKFDSRKLMEMAVEAMRRSVREPRSDGKASPMVGAVLFGPDGIIQTACRGELRHGDHAEYTLLERMNRDSKLDGSILFATLEPCAPGSRRHPKLGCAERIVHARIAEVWVGIEDPDPTVDRKGIKYLQDNGVTVHMFDRDLQEVIREENREFIIQALERASTVESDRKSKIVALSRFEDSIAHAVIENLSLEALEKYRTTAKIKESIDSQAFRLRLLQQGLLKEDAGKLVPTGFGLLLFGSEPRNIFPQAGLLGTVHYSDGKEEPHDFDGPTVLIPSLVEEWLGDKLPNTIDRSRMQRRKTPLLPFEMVREVVVNALVHRNYDITGAKCQLVVRPDTIVVMSPGGPLAPITLELLQSFKAPMLSRNPMLHYVFARMDLAEERGLGMKTLQRLPKEYGLPLPKYHFDDPYLVVTIYRSAESVALALGPEVRDSLNKDELVGWEFLATRVTTTMAEYAENMRFDNRKAQRHLKRFVELGLLRRRGAGPSTTYEVVRS